MNSRVTLDQVGILETVASRRKANDFFTDFFSCVLPLIINLCANLSFAPGNTDGLRETKLTVSLRLSHFTKTC